MEATLLLVLDLVGTFAFALDGALTALRAARLGIVGVVTLGMITALGAAPNAGVVRVGGNESGVFTRERQPVMSGWFPRPGIARRELPRPPAGNADQEVYRSGW